MAPFLEQALQPRQMTNQNCDFYDNGNCGYFSSWYWWGRWVFAGVVIVFIILLFVCFGCLSNRRRRRRGLNPYYGTGWMGGPPRYGPPPGGAPPPQYSARPMPNQYTGTTFNPNDGYYGQNEGIQLQQPQNSYYPPREVDNHVYSYTPSPGSPPNKTVA